MKINKKKIIDIENITFKEKIGLIVTIAVLLMVFTMILSNSNNVKNGINYNQEVDVDYIIAISDENNDRKVYNSLNRIITNFLNSYNLELDNYSGDVELGYIKHTRKDYYKVLNSNYKNRIGRIKYNSITKEFMQRFIVSDKYGQYMKTSQILKKVYKLSSYEYSDNMYICKLNTLIENENAYIGIQLNEITEQYNIFYIGLGEKNE